MKTGRSSFNHLLGLVGGAGTGKDTVAGILAEHGFVHVSSSELVRAEIARRGLITSRQLQTEIANEQRVAHGCGYWVDAAIDLVPAGTTDAVISGLYAPGEGQHLVHKHGGALVGIMGGQADMKTRYARIQARANGARDTLDVAAFEAAHQRENSGVEPFETNIDTLLSMVHFTINNTGELADLRTQTITVINELKGDRV